MCCEKEDGRECHPPAEEYSYEEEIEQFMDMPQLEQCIHFEDVEQ